MKTKNLFLIFAIGLVMLQGCDDASQEDPNSKKFEPIEVGEIELHPSLIKALNNYSSSQIKISVSLFDTPRGNGYIEIPNEFKQCIDSSTSPKNIRDLKYGLTLDAYKFDKDDQAKLGFLGFGNVNIENKETIIVVEYKQTGTQLCNNYQLFYGIGARLMMHIKKTKRSAKINTPQQISASVIFGKADVIFSVKTFGITGPGVARLVKSGTMTENTYTEFLNEISSLIVDAYSDTTKFIIAPQPLFLKQE